MTPNLDERLRAAAQAPPGGEAPPSLVAAVRARRRRSVTMIRTAMALLVVGALGALGVSWQDPDPAAFVAGAPNLDPATANWVARADAAGADAMTYPDGLPDELRRFVAARGGVPDTPVVTDPAVTSAEVAVACVPAAGARSGRLADAGACTFVYRYDFVAGTAAESTRMAERLCLREQATAALSACVPDAFGEVAPIAGTTLEAVVYWRSTDLPAGGLAVTAADRAGTAFAALPAAVLTWHNCPSTVPCPESGLPR